jgi:hypothetical protein
MPIASPRYALTATMVSGAPNDPGVYALWENDELIYYGHARQREAELLREFQRAHKKLPRCNSSTD